MSLSEFSPFSMSRGLDTLAVMKYPLSLAAIGALLFGAIQAQGASVIYNFTDGTSDGWSNSGFGTTPASPVSNIGGNNYIFVPLGGFQTANVSAGADGSDFYNTMLAAAANPSGYNISYNWLVDTSTFGANAGTFLQLGLFVNSGSGAYAQDFGSPNEVQLSGAQLARGQVFSGQISVYMGAVGFCVPPTDTFFRLGIIENGNGAAPVGAYFTGISVTPVPEPSSLSLFGLAVPAFWMMRRRQLARR